MKSIAEGSSHTEIFYPGPEHLASRVGNHGVDVVATTAIILFFEAASHNLVSPYFDAGEVTVGTRVNVDHLEPATADIPLMVIATLRQQQGRRLEFDLEARQHDNVVMTGSHFRAVMQRDRFSKAQSKSIEQIKSVDFWFDFHSPWCYFASHRIGQIGREFDVVINWKPVHLANLSEAVDGRRPLEANPPFVAWYQQDQRDSAKLLGLPFEPYKNYPARPSRALRAALYAQENGLAEPLVKSLMRGYWSQQKDISDIEWVCVAGAKVGLQSAALERAMTATEYKEKLANNLEAAVASNLFGLPAAMIDGKIFWGNDRLDLLRHYLSGQTPRLEGDS